MPLRNHIPALLLLSLILMGCAKPTQSPYHAEIVNSNIWYSISFGNEQQVAYYSPFQTSYSSDGIITTLISQWNGKDSERKLIGMFEMNCFDKTLKINVLNSNGTWQMSQDWKQVEKNTNGQAILEKLCLKSIGNREGIEFLATTYAQNTGQYESYFWNPNENLSSADRLMKVFRISLFKQPNGGWSDFFFTVNCENRYYAMSSEPNPKDLKWNSSPTESPAGLITIKACGFSKSGLDNAKKQSQQNSVATTKGAQKAKGENTSTTPRSQVPVIRTVQVNFESSPNGATVKDVKSGQTVGVTPFIVNYNLDVTKLKDGRCSEISALSFEWISGAKAKTSNPYKVCMYADDRISISMQRPKTPGLQTDIDYQVKLQQLKIQQEALAAQQRQAAAAEQQAQAQQAQAAAEAEQAKSAQNALLLQMFQGGSMINKPSTKMPIHCSPIGSGYSCY